MDQAPEALRVFLNEIRETAIQDGSLYGKQVGIIEPTTTFSQWAAPLLNNEDVMNEFMPVLLKRIVYTWVDQRIMRNPLQDLQGDEIPLGYAGQEIYTNPVDGIEFDDNDFAGLLCRYESDTKVQYNHVNARWQFPITISYDNVRSAFVSWGSLYEFIQGQVQALYNGYYVRDYNTTKSLVAAAYRENMVQVRQITAPTDAASARALIQAARGVYLNMLQPSNQYNAWAKVGGYGRPIMTMMEPQDAVILIRNDILALVDVEVLARAFNLDSTKLIGRVYGVDSFDQYDRDGNKIYDGSNILFAIGDRRWFRIKTQMQKFDQFYNAKNTTWNCFLRVNKMYNYSFFANMVVYATALPSVTITGLEFTNNAALSVPATTSVSVPFTTTPSTGNSPEVTATATSGTVVVNNATKTLTYTAPATAGTDTITIKAGTSITATKSVTVTAAPTATTNMNLAPEVAKKASK